MWDYNVGLVRMTPFFKCLEYGKVCLFRCSVLDEEGNLLITLDYSCENAQPEPGAQGHYAQHHWGIYYRPRYAMHERLPTIDMLMHVAGYWMPYSCAKAVCATFCYQIAGALIPLFGPSFPSDCIREGMPGYKHMVIDPDIIAKARLEARRLLHLPTPRSGPLLSPRMSRSVSPRPCPRPPRLAAEPYSNRIDYDRPMPLSPHSNADHEFYAGSPDIYSRNTPTEFMPGGYGTGIRPPPMNTPTRWTPVNLPRPYPSYRSDPSTEREQRRPQHQHHQYPQPWTRNNIEDKSYGSRANPWLSAVPRIPSPYPQRAVRSPTIQNTTARPYERPAHTLPPIRSLYQSLGANKRTFDQIERPTSSHSTPATDQRPDISPYPKLRGLPPASRSLSPSMQPVRPASEEDAALTLMRLCEKTSKQEEKQEREQRQDDAIPESSGVGPKGESNTISSSLVTTIGSPTCSSGGQTRVWSEDADLKMEHASTPSSPHAGDANVTSTPNSLATRSVSSSSDADDEDNDDCNDDVSPRRRGGSKRRRVLS